MSTTRGNCNIRTSHRRAISTRCLRGPEDSRAHSSSQPCAEFFARSESPSYLCAILVAPENLHSPIKAARCGTGTCLAPIIRSVSASYFFAPSATYFCPAFQTRALSSAETEVVHPAIETTCIVSSSAVPSSVICRPGFFAESGRPERGGNSGAVGQSGRFAQQSLARNFQV